MPESMKNRDVPPIGARVRPAHDKLSTREGTVVGHVPGWSGQGAARIHWDGDPPWRTHDREACEVTVVKGES